MGLNIGAPPRYEGQGGFNPRSHHFHRFFSDALNIRPPAIDFLKSMKRSLGEPMTTYDQ